MIHFKKLRYKNILSAGNVTIEISLDRSDTTLVVGQNGAGKSSMLDALSFALFGKAHRQIKKNQLINSINGKGALVEVEFNVNNSDFKIVRGIKPSKFEIWQNGKMINQSSDNRDYQKMLEANILKLNHKSFHQIVVLGSSNFIPFMQLPAHSRREVIEDLLDINIFSKMNVILKERTSKIKEELRHVDHGLSIAAEKMTHHEKYITEMETLNKDSKARKLQQITDIQSEISAINDTIADLQGQGTDIGEAAVVQDNVNLKLQNTQASVAKTMAAIQTLVKESKFYDVNDTCPVCAQPMSPDFKEEKMEACKHNAKSVHSDMVNFKQEEAELRQSLSDITSKIEMLKSQAYEVKNCQSKITVLQSQITEKNDEIGELNKRQLNVDEEVKKGYLIRDSINELTTKKGEYVEERTYNTVIAEMLKDTGIKTKIIRQYLPAMNKLINQYLQVLDFFVSFYLDESFTETIRSRHRDDFNYSSFSEGEKQRIDLALLFTWRQIAKMKNSTNTNLLILDETFDSSLDVDGLDNLSKILGTLPADSNVFVISHKGEALEQKFESKITFYKDGNFSKIR